MSRSRRFPRRVKACTLRRLLLALLVPDVQCQHRIPDPFLIAYWVRHPCMCRPHRLILRSPSHRAVLMAIPMAPLKTFPQTEPSAEPFQPHTVCPFRVPDNWTARSTAPRIRHPTLLNLSIMPLPNQTRQLFRPRSRVSTRTRLTASVIKPPP